MAEAHRMANTVKLCQATFGVALVLVLSLAACRSGPLPTSQPTAVTPTFALDDGASDAAPPRKAPEHPGGAYGFTHFVFQQLGDSVLTTLVEGPRGAQVRVPYSLPDLQEIVSSSTAVPARAADEPR